MDKARLAGLAAAGAVAGYFIYRSLYKREEREERAEAAPPGPGGGRPGIEPRIAEPPEWREPGILPPEAPPGVEIKAGEAPVETPVAEEGVPEEMPKQPQPVERGYPSFIWEKQPPQPKCVAEILSPEEVKSNPTALEWARQYCQAMGCTGEVVIPNTPFGTIIAKCKVVLP